MASMRYLFAYFMKGEDRASLLLRRENAISSGIIDSNSEIDFGIQRRCIKAFIEFWSNEEYIENMFLWTWDARPYPAWPHMNIWNDGYLWEKGHWINDKFGTATVASIILEISRRCKIDLENVEIKTIDEALMGAIFNNINSVNVTIYFF